MCWKWSGDDSPWTWDENCDEREEKREVKREMEGEELLSVYPRLGSAWLGSARLSSPLRTEAR
jgi:hypothetical protein